MKYSLFLVMLVSMLWSWYAFPNDSPVSMLLFSSADIMGIIKNSLNSLVGMYKYTFPSVFWLLFLVYVYDFISSMLNRNTPYMRALYETCKVELLILLLTSLFTFLLFWRTQNTFTEYSVDISMAGLSFMLLGNISYLRLFKFKLGNINYPFKIALIISTIFFLSSFYFIKVIYDIANGEYNGVQSVWLQITIFTYSISLYFSSKHVTFIINKRKLGASPAMLSLFKSLLGRHNLYQELVNGIDVWNREVKNETAKSSAILRKRKKRK